MKNSTDGGFDQHYNAQVVVAQKSLLIVANTISNHANDKKEAMPTVDALDERLGQARAAALDNGYFSESNIADLEARSIDPMSPLDESPIIRVGGNTSSNTQSRLRRQRAPKRRWPINSGLRWAR
jgi:transposase